MPEAKPALLASVLGDAELRVAMVQVLAFQLRQPPPRGSESNKYKLQRHNGLLIADLLTTVLQSEQPAAEAGKDLAGMLLRTHALQAAARQLAAFAESGAWRDARAATLGCAERALRLASALVGLECEACIIAVAESRLLDHAARLLFLVKSTATPQAELIEALQFGLAVETFVTTSRIVIVQYRDAAAVEQVAALRRRMETAEARVDRCRAELTAKLQMAEDVPGEPEPTAPSWQSDEDEDGPCTGRLEQLCEGRGMRTALVLLGAAAMRGLEGEAAPQGLASWLGGVVGAGVLKERLDALLDALSPRLPWKGPPGPLTATRLLLRLGLALTQQRPAAAGATAAVAASAAGPSSTSGNTTRRRTRGAGAPLPPNFVLPETRRWKTAERALHCAAEFVSARCPLREERPGWTAAAEGAWRLAASVLRGAGAVEAAAGAGVPEAGAEKQKGLTQRGTDLRDLVLTVESLWREASDSQEGCWVFSEKAPPGVAAAAAGGALPLLERLLRRTGNSSADTPGATILAYVRSHGPGNWEPAVPLLAYGPPLQAAALLATATKLLRGTHPQCLLHDGSSTGAQGLVFVADLIQLLAIRPASVDVEGAGGGSAAWGANHAIQQLALVLSLALPDWVRQLARLLREAAALEEEAWQQELAAGKEARGAKARRIAEAEAVAELECEEEVEQADWMLVHRLLFHLKFMLDVVLPLSADQDLQEEGPPEPGPDPAQQPRQPERTVSPDGSCATGEQPTAAEGTLSGTSRSSDPVIAPTEAAELMGAALTLLQRLAPSQAGTGPFLNACAGVGGWCLDLAALIPAEVRATCSGGAGSHALAWRPEAIREVAAALAGVEEVRGLVADLEALAVRVEGWWAAGGQGEGEGKREGRGESEGEGERSGEAEGVDHAEEVMVGAKEEAGAEAGTEGVDHELTGSLGEVVAWFTVSPAEARRRLGLSACSNPACANTAGDSEVGLRLRMCGRCGRVSYCCRECQTAHWHAGHQDACGGGGKVSTEAV